MLRSSASWRKRNRHVLDPGDWDDALATADRFIAECEESPHLLEAEQSPVPGLYEARPWDTDEALDDFRRALALARETPSDPQNMAPALVRSAWRIAWVVSRMLKRRSSEALPFLRKDPFARPWTLAEVAVDLGQTAEVREILEPLHSEPGHGARCSPWSTGRFKDAAEHYGMAEHPALRG